MAILDSNKALNVIHVVRLLVLSLLTCKDPLTITKVVLFDKILFDNEYENKRVYDCVRLFDFFVKKRLFSVYFR